MGPSGLLLDGSYLREHNHVQVTLVGRRVWMALVLAVPARLWLGGVISPQRDALDGGEVADRLRLQLLLAAGEVARGGACRSPLEVAGAHAGDGRRADVSSVDDARTVPLPRAALFLGGA